MPLLPATAEPHTIVTSLDYDPQGWDGQLPPGPQLTKGVCLAELSRLRCVHITVLGKQEFYRVHFDLADATEVHNLAGWESTQCTHEAHTHTDMYRDLSGQRHTGKHTGDTPDACIM